jgi:hypothetical protein
VTGDDSRGRAGAARLGRTGLCLGLTSVCIAFLCGAVLLLGPASLFASVAILASSPHLVFIRVCASTPHHLDAFERALAFLTTFLSFCAQAEFSLTEQKTFDGKPAYLIK